MENNVIEPQVFVVQPTPRPKDLSSAHRYGTIRHIFEDPLFQASIEPGIARRKMEEALSTFVPERDYVLFLGGDPAGAILLGAILRDQFPGRSIRMLRWERERDVTGKRVAGAGFYVPTMLHH